MFFPQYCFSTQCGLGSIPQMSLQPRAKASKSHLAGGKKSSTPVEQNGITISVQACFLNMLIIFICIIAYESKTAIACKPDILKSIFNVRITLSQTIELPSIRQTTIVIENKIRLPGTTILAHQDQLPLLPTCLDIHFDLKLIERWRNRQERGKGGGMRGRRRRGRTCHCFNFCY